MTVSVGQTDGTIVFTAQVNGVWALAKGASAWIWGLGGPDRRLNRLHTLDLDRRDRDERHHHDRQRVADVHGRQDFPVGDRAGEAAVGAKLPIPSASKTFVTKAKTAWTVRSRGRVAISAPVQHAAEAAANAASARNRAVFTEAHGGGR